MTEYIVRLTCGCWGSQVGGKARCVNPNCIDYKEAITKNIPVTEESPTNSTVPVTYVYINK